MSASIWNSRVSRGGILRVLHVLYDLYPSGAEVMLRVAEPYFRQEKISCEILSIGTNGVGPYAQTLEDAGYIIHHLPFSRSLRFFINLRRFVKCERFDIVHIHTEKASAWVAACVVPYAKLVRTIHNNFSFTGWLGFRRKLTRMMTRSFGVRQLAISPSVQATEWRYLWNQTELCLNWYDSDHFHRPTAQERLEARASLLLAGKEIAIVSIGNCSNIKNHMAILEALSLLPEYPQLIYFHIGHEDEAQTERSQAVYLGIGERAKFFGACTDVRSFLYAADLIVMPSLFEGLPISLLEALACGVPGVLSNVRGLQDFGDWFPTTHFCEPNGASLASSIRKFLNRSSTELSKIAGDNADRARQMFGAAEGVRRYASVYRRLMSHKNGSRSANKSDLFQFL